MTGVELLLLCIVGLLVVFVLAMAVRWEIERAEERAEVRHRRSLDVLAAAETARLRRGDELARRRANRTRT